MLLENSKRGNALKVLFTFLLSILLSNASHSFSKKPDFEKIKKEVTNLNSPYFIDKLASRYLNNDASLTTEELQYLYYGYKLAKKEYNPMSYTEKDKALQALSAVKNNYAAAITKCKNYLSKDMFDMDFYHYKGLFEYEVNRDIAASDKNFNFYYNLCKTIKSSGTGTSETDPVYIINKNHITFIAKLLGLQPETIVEKGNTIEVSIKKNDMSVDKLYFSFPEQTIENTTTQAEPIANTTVTTTIAEPQQAVASNTTSETPTRTPSYGNSFMGSSFTGSSHASTSTQSSFTTETPTVSHTANETTTQVQVQTTNSLQSQTVLSEREKFAAERKAERERIIAERMAEREKIIAERMAERERLVSERKQKTNTKP